MFLTSVKINLFVHMFFCCVCVCVCVFFFSCISDGRLTVTAGDVTKFLAGAKSDSFFNLVALILTDPPWNVLKDGSGSSRPDDLVNDNDK